MWILRQRFTVLICLMFLTSMSLHAEINDPSDLIGRSQQLLYAVRTGEDSIEAHQEALARADEDMLASQLKTDREKKAFWLNIYNAYVQWLLQQHPDRYKDRHSFFSSRQITVAGRPLSLDDIEHGILRRSRAKWSLGYAGKLFPSAFEKKFRVDTIDYRIHFALNCGAKSCPPIAYYQPEKIHQQLNLATKNYLRTEVEFDAEKNLAYLPAIMSWFRADFGGKKGIKQLLEKEGFLPRGTDPGIRFKSYDWSLYLNNYKTETNE